MTNQSGNNTIPNQEISLWQAAGLLADPGVDLDIVATVAGAAIGTAWLSSGPCSLPGIREIMATWLWGANPGFQLDQVVETNPGPATTANNVELNVDLSAAIVHDNGATRIISREEVLIILNLFSQKIIRDTWPPTAGEE